MDSSDLLTPRRSAFRHYAIVMAFAVFGLLLIFCGDKLYPYWQHLRPGVDMAPTPSLDATSTKGEHGMSRSEPLRLEIPAIHLDATFVSPLVLNPDRTVSVPANYTEVGWYGGGAAPGEIGSAVILGHVDSKSGPAVFYSLGQVKVGDEIKITRADGATVTFVVTELKRYLQSEFPTELVYGPTDKSMIRLVTCSGLYDHGQQRYSHNLVVSGIISEQ